MSSVVYLHIVVELLCHQVHQPFNARATSHKAPRNFPRTLDYFLPIYIISWRTTVGDFALFRPLVESVCVKTRPMLIAYSLSTCHFHLLSAASRIARMNYCTTGRKRHLTSTDMFKANRHKRLFRQGGNTTLTKTPKLDTDYIGLY